MREEIRNERVEKLKKIQEAGVDPYPARVKRTHVVAAVLKAFAALSRTKKKISLAGRVIGMRDQGGVVFLDLEDTTGRIQCVLKKDMLPSFELFKVVLDRGDFFAVTGTLFATKRGEKSIDVREAKILAKTLLPLPTEWYGLEDVETRMRQRYLEFVLHPDSRGLFRKKAAFWEEFRNFLKHEGFLEVEAPVLEAVPGGAEAEPFVTHMNALDTDFYLRISLELPLKKLLVGGFEAVFELGRIFRNEGISREHLQDYTQLEFYWAYHDYNDLMVLVEKLYKSVIKKTIGSLTTISHGEKINWGKKWPRVDYVEAFVKANKIDPVRASRDELFKKARELNLEPEKSAGKGRLIDLIYKKTVRPTFIQPAFLINPPVEVEPLAKRIPGKPGQVERIQIMAAGTELGKGFSELNDPMDQRARFEEQMKLREAGDKEAQMLDEDFLTALEYGMPPAAGFGVSERLFAVLMDKPVRETVIYPLMKTKQEL